MKTLNQFKHENNITTIDLVKGKGRAFATVRDQLLVVASKTDLNKPLFVTDSIRRPYEGVDIPEGTKLDDSNSKEDKNSHWIVNSVVEAAGTI